MDFNQLPNENSKRFIAILNKKIETGRLMNALGHMTAGLAGKVGVGEDMCFLEYKDKDEGIRPWVFRCDTLDECDRWLAMLQQGAAMSSIRM